MFDKYLVTGATGFLGRAVVEELVRRRAQVYALVLHNDPYIDLLPKEVPPTSVMCAIKARWQTSSQGQTAAPA